MDEDVGSPQDDWEYNDVARVDDLIKYLDEEPPYEAVGRVVVAAAELELNLIGLALDLGIEPKMAWYRDKRTQFLRRSGALRDDVLARIAASTESRDLLSHGVWMNLMSRGQAFLRADKESLGQNLRGRLVTPEDLSSWRYELLELVSVVEEARRRVSPRSV